MPRLLAAFAIASLLGACSLNRPSPPVNYYGIEPGPPARAVSATRVAETLRVGQVRVAASYAGAELVYRLDEVRFVADFYHRLIAPPGAMLGNSIAAWLDAAGPLRLTAAPGTALPTRYVLDVAIDELYGDFRPGQPPQAVLRMQLALLDTASATPRTLLERTFVRRAPLPAATPAALVAGYARAVGEVLAELQPELAHALP